MTAPNVGCVGKAKSHVLTSLIAQAEAVTTLTVFTYSITCFGSEVDLRRAVNEVRGTRRCEDQTGTRDNAGRDPGQLPGHPEWGLVFAKPRGT